MHVHGPSFSDAEVAQGGIIVTEEASLVDELYWAMLGELILKVGPAKE